MMGSRGGLFGLATRQTKYVPSHSDSVRKIAAWGTTIPLSGIARLLYPVDAAWDEEGNVVCQSHHGRHDSEYGWDIDHRIPSALGGTDALSNLRALHFRANRSQGGALGNILSALNRK